MPLTRLLDLAYQPDPSTPLTVTAQVTTSNSVSSKAGGKTSFTLPKAVQGAPASASFDFTTGQLVMTAPRWTVSGVRLPVTWWIDGSVKCHQPDGASTGRSGYLGVVWDDETSTSLSLPVDCDSVDLAADMEISGTASTTPVVHLEKTFIRPGTAG